MKHERYSALWVLAPLCGLFLAFTGGMRFRGWFAGDFGIRTDSLPFTLAFVFALVISHVVIGGYLLGLKKIHVGRLRIALLSTLVVVFSALTLVALVDAVSGQSSSYLLAAALSILMICFGALLRHRLTQS